MLYLSCRGARHSFGTIDASANDNVAWHRPLCGCVMRRIAMNDFNYPNYESSTLRAHGRWVGAVTSVREDTLSYSLKGVIVARSSCERS